MLSPFFYVKEILNLEVEPFMIDMKKVLVVFVSVLLSLVTFSQESFSVFSKAIESQEAGNFKNAIKLYTKVLKDDSTIFSAFYNRGFCYSATGEGENSISDFLAFLEYVPNDSNGLFALAAAYGFNGNYRKSIKTYQIVERVNAKLDYIDYFNLGSAYYFLGISDSAKIFLNKSFNLDSINSPAVNNLAWVYLDENPEKSCFYFTEAYLKDTLDSKNINNLGYSHLLCGNLDTAYELFKKAQKIDSNNSFIYRNLGLYYKTKDQKELACKNLKKAIALDIMVEWGESYVQELIEYCK